MSEEKFAIGGIQSVIEMMREMDEPSRNKLLKNLEKENLGLVEILREKLYLFEDLTNLSPKEMQVLLNSVPEEKLVIALRSTSDEVKQSVLANVSKRVAADLEDQLENSPQNH